MELILLALGILIILICGYYASIHIIKLWTGCDNDEAASKIHSLINGKVQNGFDSDLSFFNEVWENVKNIIGERRFEELIMLSNTEINTPLLAFGSDSGLPCISVSTYYVDENEKKRLENVFRNIVRKYLHIYGFEPQILINWKTRYDLQMPYINIMYARSKSEKHIMDMLLKSTRKRIISRNAEVHDETEKERLHE